jgi:hypothetical protein
MNLHLMPRAAVAVVALAGLWAHAQLPTPSLDQPRYFQTFRTNFKEPIALTGEMSEANARAHSLGASVYLGWFDPAGLLLRYEKQYKGKVLRRVYYTYENGTPTQIKTIDETGRETISSL